MTNWDKDKPAGNQKIRLSDDEIRANWDALQTSLANEHYFPDSSDAMKHKFPIVSSLSAGTEGAVEIWQNILCWFSNGAWRTACLPIGSIFQSVSPINPLYQLGYGTWERIAQGRVLVGQSDADTDFSTAGQTGGVKTQDISHNHSLFKLGVTTNPVNNYYGVQDATEVGGNSSLSNMPPYYTVYIWVRTA